MKAVEIRNLSYTYPNGRRVLHNISFDVEKGEAIALVGPNGSGKTTLLLHLNGILKGNGEVKIFGVEVNDGNLLNIRKKVGMIFQNPDDQLFSSTVFDDVAFGPLNLGLNKEKIAEAVREALERVKMGGYENFFPYHLSFGEKKRVSIATILAMKPEILVLDEPTLGLDPWIKKDFLKLFEELKKNYTIIVATHDIKLIKRCDRSIFIKNGRII